MILHLTFISTVSIAVTWTLCPTTHTIFLLRVLTADITPYRPTLDAYFHNPFYASLFYRHPPCMIFNLNLMPPSQSKHSLYGMDGFFSHISIFHIPRGQGLSLFSLSVQVNLVNSIAYKVSFSNYLLVYLGSECTKLQLWWLSIFKSF